MFPINRIIPPLTLRFKIFIALGCYIFGILAMTFVTQNDLLTARNKLEALELAYRMDTIVLEVRRYEKNFLLYGSEEALQDNQRQVQLALETTNKLHELTQKLKVHPMLIDLGNLLHSYQEKIALLKEQHEGNNIDAIQILASSLRNDGQEMHELSTELVRFERQQIRNILQKLIEQLMLWSSMAIAVGIIIPFVMFLKVFRPLKIIKNATEDIASGKFIPVEVVNTRDEMQQVIEAFNTMVAELQRRLDQLVQSQKLVSVGTLSAGIAHQLNNPLNNISTSCQIAISEFDTGERDFIRKMLTNIDQETARARDVVQGLLEFSREKEFSLRMTNLESIVNRAVRLVRSQIAASIQINIDIPPDLDMPLDSQRMQEVFLNLLINASHAITGSGTIDISASVAEEAERVSISVHDNGCGIPQEIQARLFDPFFSTKEEGQGTGLGLSITYGIIQKHDGEISVSSDPGKGTSFLIQLPLHSEKCQKTRS